MPIRRELPPRSVDSTDVMSGGVEPHYRKVLTRLLAAHALAEKLTALGYERVKEALGDSALAPEIEKNLREERKHARLIYRLLDELGTTQLAADRSMVSVLKSPSFAAPRHFAGKAASEMDLAMASLSLDMTGMIIIGANYQDSSYTPHARAAESILEEEADHEIFATEQLGRAAERFGAEAVEAALGEWLPRAVNFFGPPGSGFTYDCIRYGLKSRDNGELAELYVTLLTRRCEQLGLKMPALTAAYPHSLA
ncbi:MAG TPA: Phenylacetic acid catabolic protein [Candidatus Binataceae bacterium]|nr:Phenylacetic acid catabolic protein [Candidatus Binataceae bacterium]